MQSIELELTKELYDIYKSLPYGKAEDLFLETYDKDGHWQRGYGFYGVIFFEKDEKYYARCTIGKNCD